MARSAVSEEEIQLRKRARRRLMGAIALAVLVVAALPLILDGEPPPRAEQIEVRIAPAKPPPDERAPTPAPVSQGTEPQLSEPDPADATAAVAIPSPPGAPDHAPALAAERNAASDIGNAEYAVAVIATASPARAAQMKQALQRLKFPVYTQKTPDGDKTRVRVGPFASREAAEQARQRLVRQGYDPGKVVRRGE